MKSISSVLYVVFLILGSLQVFAQGTAFTYQGRLDNNGAPFTGTAEFQPTLWSASSGGTPLATNAPPTVLVSVTNGLFVMPLNFGAYFTGADRWLQLEVRTTIGPFTTLTPRQQISPTPYAITASNISGTLSAAQISGTIPSSNLSGTYSNAIALTNSANVLSGDGAGLINLSASQLVGPIPNASLDNAWKTTGNGGTTAGTQFIGTTDNQPLEIKVNGVRALRLEPNTNGAANVIGGSALNSVNAGTYGATIAGGGAVMDGLGNLYTNYVSGNFGTIGGGAKNLVLSSYSTIAGGYANALTSVGSYSFIGGGMSNVMGFSCHYSVIAGGANNVNENGDFAVIGGGDGNRIQSTSYSTTISGGTKNTIASGNGVIGGGFTNSIGLTADNSTIGGGTRNRIENSSPGSTISGGTTNLVSGDYGTVPGGANNTAAGNYSMAAGYSSYANGNTSVAMGYDTLANASFSTAMGYGTIAGGNTSTAMGYSSEANGSGATAMGRDTLASGDFSTAMGYFSTASGYISVAMGAFTTASGESAFAMGNGSDATGAYSMAIGAGTTASNLYAIAMGDSTTAGGVASTAMGAGTLASGSFSTAMGYSTTAGGTYSLAAGRRARATHNGSFVWGDSTDADVNSTTNNQFTVRAGNGVRLTQDAGNTKTVAVGEHYRDNAVVAWGRCTAAGAIGDTSFGVTSVTKNGTGRYDIVLSASALSSSHLVPVANPELDSQPTTAASARLVSVNQTGASTFSIFINSGTFAAVDNDFVFMVTAR